MDCTLCPRQCHGLRTEETGNGFCRLPDALRIARIAPHLWEEPPISGLNGTGAVFFSGCIPTSSSDSTSRSMSRFT